MILSSHHSEGDMVKKRLVKAVQNRSDQIMTRNDV